MDTQHKVPTWTILVYIAVVTVVMIVGDAVLYHHPMAGHILLTVGGVILFVTLITVAIRILHDKKKKREQEEDQEPQETHYGSH